MDTSFFGKDGFIWWKGVVEDRKDPIFLGRVRVRIFGWHTDDKLELPTEDLPWAMPSLPLDNGRNPVGLKEGDWVWGFFIDGPEAQKPIVVGYIPGIDEKPADPETGFNDPTPDDQLTATTIPRPPEMVPIEEVARDEETGEVTSTTGGRFGDPNRLPGQNIAFGQLTKDYSANSYKYDVNNDGRYDQKDADTIRDLNKDGTPGNEKEFFSGVTSTTASVPISRYPLENRLMEPSTSRLTRNEKIEETLVAVKKGELDVGVGGGYEGAGVGGDAAVGPSAFNEPETPYDAQYPYNHVYESESGHVIEVDDTPGKQRMHWYHRSGTFTEIHPDGLEVNKVKKSQYNFIYEDYYNATKKSINMDAGEAFRIKAAQVVNIDAGSDHNRQTGANLNALVGKNINTRVAENTHTVIEKESWTHVSDGTYLYVKDGVLHIRAKKDISIMSEEGNIELLAPAGVVSCSAPVVNLQGPMGASNTINLVSANINSIFLRSHVAAVAFPAIGAPPANPTPGPLVDNKADDDSWYDDGPTDASSKFGFILANGTAGDVWKPISESDQKLVTLSAAGADHVLMEAIPTGELQAVRIRYIHPDMTITEWQVVRPVHIPGKVIDDSPRVRDMFEDGKRYMSRWTKSGKEYPKQLFWVIGNKQNLILDSAERHQCIPGPFNEKLNFDLRTTRADTNTGDTNNTNTDPEL